MYLHTLNLQVVCTVWILVTVTVLCLLVPNIHVHIPSSKLSQSTPKKRHPTPTWSTVSHIISSIWKSITSRYATSYTLRYMEIVHSRQKKLIKTCFSSLRLRSINETQLRRSRHLINCRVPLSLCVVTSWMLYNNWTCVCFTLWAHLTLFSPNNNEDDEEGERIKISCTPRGGLSLVAADLLALNYSSTEKNEPRCWWAQRERKRERERGKGSLTLSLLILEAAVMQFLTFST